MTNKQLKAILMALLSPQGSVLNLNEQNFQFLDRNSREIMDRCGLELECEECKVEVQKE